MRRDWLIVILMTLAASPAAAGARHDPPKPIHGDLMLIDYSLPDDRAEDMRRWMLPEVDEPDSAQPKPMLRIRGTKLKMRVPI